MLDSLLTFVLNNMQLTLTFCAALVAASLPFQFSRGFFATMLFFGMGMGELWQFGVIIHKLSHTSSLATSSSDQLQLAIAYCALGLGGICASFANWYFRCAVIVIGSIFSWGNVATEFYSLYTQGLISSAGNGLRLWSMLIVPLILIILLPVNYESNNHEIYY